jgi:hypothetical protein
MTTERSVGEYVWVIMTVHPAPWAPLPCRSPDRSGLR